MINRLCESHSRFFQFHYTVPGGAFTAVYQTEPGKPLVALLFSVLGVLFLFSSIMSALIARIFCGEEQKRENIACNRDTLPKLAGCPVFCRRHLSQKANNPSTNAHSHGRNEKI